MKHGPSPSTTSGLRGGRWQSDLPEARGSRYEPLQCVMSTEWLNGHWDHLFWDTTVMQQALSIRSQVFSSQVAWNAEARFEHAVKSANRILNSLWPKDQRDQYWVALFEPNISSVHEGLRKTTGMTSINQHQLWDTSLQTQAGFPVIFHFSPNQETLSCTVCNTSHNAKFCFAWTFDKRSAVLCNSLEKGNCHSICAPQMLSLKHKFKRTRLSQTHFAIEQLHFLYLSTHEVMDKMHYREAGSCLISIELDIHFSRIKAPCQAQIVDSRTIYIYIQIRK